MDRVIQLAVANAPDPVLDPGFSGHSHGFHHGGSAHDAVEQALEHLNGGYCRVVDLDIGKLLDMVNHDKLVPIIGTKVSGRPTLHLTRRFPRTGVSDGGRRGDPQRAGRSAGGSLSPLPANIHLDLFNKELDKRGPGCCRHADDVVFVGSGKAASRVMDSIARWLEHNLLPTVGPTRTRVTLPSRGTFPGFQFWNQKGKWRVGPAKDRVRRLHDRMREVPGRKRAGSPPLAVTFTRANRVIRGWIDCFRIGSMKGAMDVSGEWTGTGSGSSSPAVEEATDHLPQPRHAQPCARRGI